MTSINTDSINFIRHSKSYISSYSRQLPDDFSLPSDYNQRDINKVISLLANFYQEHQEEINRTNLEVINSAMKEDSKLERMKNIGLLWQQFDSILKSKLSTIDDCNILFDCLIWKYEHHGLWFSPAISLFVAEYMLSAYRELKNKYLWLKRSIFCSICYVKPLQEYIDYTGILFKITLTLFPEVNAIYHYRKLAAFYKNYGFISTKLPRLLNFFHNFTIDLIEKTLSQNQNANFVIGIESRQFAFQIMEICSVLPPEDKKGLQFIKNHIVFLLDEAYAANINLLEEFCKANDIRTISAPDLMHEIKTSNHNWIVFDQYCLAGLYNWLNPNKEKVLFSHSLMSRVEYLIENLNVNRCLNFNKNSDSTNVLKELEDSKVLIALCFKDIFRPHHSSEAFMHHRKYQLCPKEYIINSLNLIHELWPDASFIMVNDYDIHNKNINIVSYTKLHKNKSLARLMTLKLISDHQKVIVLGDCNGSFDVHAQVASHAIRLGPENAYAQNLTVYKNERQTLLSKPIDNIAKELFTRRCIESSRSSEGVGLISAAHSFIIKQTTEPIPSQKIMSNFKQLLKDIDIELNA